MRDIKAGPQVISTICMLTLVSLLLVARDLLVFHYYSNNIREIKNVESGTSRFFIGNSAISCGNLDNFARPLSWGEKIYFISEVGGYENVFLCNIFTGQLTRVTNNFKYKYMNVVKGLDHSFFDEDLIFAQFN